jgi:hypothetical protein
MVNWFEDAFTAPSFSLHPSSLHLARLETIDPRRLGCVRSFIPVDRAIFADELFLQPTYRAAF